MFPKPKVSTSCNDARVVHGLLLEIANRVRGFGLIHIKAGRCEVGLLIQRSLHRVALTSLSKPCLKAVVQP